MTGITKTILVYATRWGATAETAKEIIKVLNEEFNIEVDLVNLKDKKTKNPDIIPYENVILGVSVAKFRWAKEFSQRIDLVPRSPYLEHVFGVKQANDIIYLFFINRNPRKPGFEEGISGFFQWSFNI